MPSFPTVFMRARLYKTVGGAYITLSNAQQPDIKMVENYGATGTIDVVNGTGTSNLLSSSCRWSSGTGAVTTGMFLYLYTSSISTSNLAGIYMITQIDASDDVVRFTFGDYLQLLRATGGDYWRNHYSDSQQHTDEAVYGGWDGSSLYLTKPASVSISAARGDVKWACPVVDMDFPGSDYTDAYEVRCTLPRIPGIDLLTDISISSAATLLANPWKFQFYRDGELLGSVRFDREGKVTLTLDSPIDFTTGEYSIIVNGYVTSHSTHIYQAPYSGATMITVDDSGNETVHNDTIISIILNGYVYRNATAGEEDASDPTRYYVTGITDVTTIDSSYGTPGFTGRALITYTALEGGLSMSEIFSRICYAADCTPRVISSSTEVGIMRCGGGHYHDYLLALADMEEPEGSTYEGRQHTILADPESWGTVYLRYRYRATDGYVAQLYYGGDSAPSSSAIPMMTFTPSMTMSNRPRMAVTRGTTDQDEPIIVAMVDPDVSIGSTSLIVDSSVTTVADAALASHTEISTNRSVDWEGTVTLSGIHTDLWTLTGTYAGGAPVRIYDSRYGMSAYCARIREIEWDYEQQKTILTLNNYGEVYSSSLGSTTYMAYTAGNMSVAASSDDLYTLQYIRMDDSYPLIDQTATHTLAIRVDGTWHEKAADVVRSADYGIAVLSAYWPRGDVETTTQYGVDAVRVDGHPILTIPTYRRVDKYTNQSLIVNVQLNY